MEHKLESLGFMRLRVSGFTVSGCRVLVCAKGLWFSEVQGFRMWMGCGAGFCVLRLLLFLGPWVSGCRRSTIGISGVCSV